jgi:hypothetical protein
MVISPNKVQFGDKVSINGEVMVVKDVEGPDNLGTYDFYLTDGVKDIHKVVTDFDSVNVLP